MIRPVYFGDVYSLNRRDWIDDAAEPVPVPRMMGLAARVAALLVLGLVVCG